MPQMKTWSDSHLWVPLLNSLALDVLLRITNTYCGKVLFLFSPLQVFECKLIQMVVSLEVVEQTSSPFSCLFALALCQDVTCHTGFISPLETPPLSSDWLLSQVSRLLSVFLFFLLSAILVPTTGLVRPQSNNFPLKQLF